MTEPRPCIGKLGQLFGHRFVQAVDSQTDEEVGLVCKRCGWLIIPSHPETQRRR